MDFAGMVPIFSAVFIAELGDKTQLSALALSAGKGRESKLAVFIGASLALILCSAIAAVFGGVVARSLGQQNVAGIAGAMFLALAVFTLLSGKEETDKVGGKVQNSSIRGVFFRALSLVFVAEMGDKTQIATATFAAQASSAAVFVAASAALVSTTALGVAASSYIERWLLPRAIKIATVVIFGTFGIIYLARAFGFVG